MLSSRLWGPLGEKIIAYTGGAADGAMTARSRGAARLFQIEALAKGLPA